MRHAIKTKFVFLAVSIHYDIKLSCDLFTTHLARGMEREVVGGAYLYLVMLYPIGFGKFSSR